MEVVVTAGGPLQLSVANNASNTILLHSGDAVPDD